MSARPACLSDCGPAGTAGDDPSRGQDGGLTGDYQAKFNMVAEQLGDFGQTMWRSVTATRS